jgi:hypothetical protein
LSKETVKEIKIFLISIYQKMENSKCEKLSFSRIIWRRRMMMIAIKIGFKITLNNFKLKAKVKLYLISYL